MLNVLAIQTEGLGHGTYCRTLRECFARSGELHYDAFWTKEERSISTRLITRLASLRAPVLSAKNRNLDFGRTRIEWSYGHMSAQLAARKLQGASYDVLHLHTQVQALGAAALMRKIPTVISIDMTAYQVGEEVTMRHPATLRPSIWLEHRAFQAAAHIVAWSEWAARSVVDDHGIDSRKVTVVPPGVRMWMLDPIEVVPRSQPRVLFIGNDFVRKGGRDLLDVFSEYFSERTELHLVTNDPLHIDAPNVHVHRGISAYSHEWQQLLASADIFVLPSYGEAFGLVLQEAATFGAAIIGSRAGGIPQTVVEGENGFLIDPGDKIALHDRLERLIADDALRLRMRQNSRARALEGYNAETNAHHLAEVFRSVARHPTLSS